MKLFYYPSACSQAPHIVLRELDLSFTLERVDAATKRTDAGRDYREINPLGYVPALELDDGEVLTEGPAIMQYLADRYSPATLAPSMGTIERARVIRWLNYVATELHQPFGPLWRPDAEPAVRAATIAHLDRRFGLIERHLANAGPYLAGPDYTLADIYLFVVRNWGSFVGYDLGAFPAIRANAARVAQRPAVQAVLATENSAIGNSSRLRSGRQAAGPQRRDRGAA